MKTTWKKLHHFIPDLAGIRIGTALGIVQRIYCGPMTVKGMCTGECDNCALSLAAAFQLKGARNAEALLTYNIKKVVAENQEAFFQKPLVIVKKTDRYGLPTPEKDPFETAFEQLGV